MFACILMIFKKNEAKNFIILKEKKIVSINKNFRLNNPGTDIN